MFERFINFLKLANNPGVAHKYVAPKNIDNQILKIFNQDFYKDENINQLESWLFYNYFDSNDSLVEKKYKMVVLSLVLDQKKAYLAKMSLINDLVKNFSKELLDNKETIVNLHDVFPIYDEFGFNRIARIRNLNSFKHQGIELIHQILDEDSENKEKINISKSIYKKFSSLGLLANKFISSKSHIEINMILQDFKFTENDINIFKNFLKTVTEPKYAQYHSITLFAKNWKTLILNECNIDNLNVFKQLYLNNEGNSSSPGFYIPKTRKNNRKEDQEHLIEFVEKRIEYLQMGVFLDKPTEVQQKQVKRVKL